MLSDELEKKSIEEVILQNKDYSSLNATYIHNNISDLMFSFPLNHQLPLILELVLYHANGSLYKTINDYPF